MFRPSTILSSLKSDKTEGGAAPLILVAGAVVGVLLVGALVGYAVYKAVDWLTHKMDYLKLFFEKYATRTFLVGVCIGALVAHNQVHT